MRHSGRGQIKGTLTVAGCVCVCLCLFSPVSHGNSGRGFMLLGYQTLSYHIAFASLPGSCTHSYCLRNPLCAPGSVLIDLSASLHHATPHIPYHRHHGFPSRFSSHRAKHHRRPPKDQEGQARPRRGSSERLPGLDGLAVTARGSADGQHTQPWC